MSFSSEVKEELGKRLDTARLRNLPPLWHFVEKCAVTAVRKCRLRS